jgi:hypothetical protein
MKLTKALFLTAAILLLAFTVTLQSCKPKCENNPDDPECADPQEVITTLKVLVKDTNNVLLNTYQFKDADNNGTPEVFDTIKIGANAAYNVSVEVWDDSKTPADNITEEVESEKDEHGFFFDTHNVTIAISYLDQDDNGLPVGLLTRWVTGNANLGHVTVTLKHQPGVKDGTSTPGETDAEVMFPVVIQ